MELHRLKSLEGIDPEVFNPIYESLKPLKHNLARGIDHRLYGITQQEVLSWFDDKLMFVFHKYYKKDTDLNILKAKIINSLMFFKTKILRKHYQANNYQLYNNIISLDEIPVQIIPDIQEIDNRELLLKLLYEFIKKRISDEAWVIFTMELHPPSYIECRLSNISARIPSKLLADYLELPQDSKTLSKLNRLRRNTQTVVNDAISFFKNHPEIYAHS